MSGCSAVFFLGGVRARRRAPGRGSGALEAAEGKLGVRRGAAEMLAARPLVQRNSAKQDPPRSQSVVCGLISRPHVFCLYLLVCYTPLALIFVARVFRRWLAQKGSLVTVLAADVHRCASLA